MAEGVGSRALAYALVIAALSCGGQTEHTSATRDPTGGAGGSGAGARAGSGSSGGGGGSNSAGNTGRGGTAGGGIGSGGSAGTANPPALGACRNDSDCRVHNECCDCLALGPSEDLPECFADCSILACDALGIAATEARCVAGRCTLDRACTRIPAHCPPAPLPPCPDGQLRFFQQDCRTGCLPPAECNGVSACSVCDQAGLTCVLELFGGRGSQTYHCVSTPAGCDGSCGCMQACYEQGAQCSVSPGPPRVLECYVDCPAC